MEGARREISDPTAGVISQPSVAGRPSGRETHVVDVPGVVRQPRLVLNAELVDRLPEDTEIRQRNRVRVPLTDHRCWTVVQHVEINSDGNVADLHEIDG